MKAPRGTRDILPGETEIWQFVEDTSRRVFRLYGYREIRTPIFESTELFQRSIGEGSTLVAKEMYTFIDKKGRSLTLRPEATASIARAYIEHKMDKTFPSPLKLYYLGPMFRYERPQAGRQRQFWQVGAEALGCSNPLLEAEIIKMVCHFFENLGLEREIELQLNSVGCMVCRPRYLKVLSLYLKDYESELCPDCKLKLRKNLLRILDCKRCNNITSGAPLILDYLCDDCKGHMRSVKKYLSQFGVTFAMNPRLVRGLDYYTRTTFEFIDSTFGAQNAVAAGGRYDRLIEELGGPGTPAVGFAAGLERMILALKSHKLMRKVQFQVELYLVSYDSVGREEIPSIANTFRQSGFSVEFDLSDKDLRGQMKLANRAGARFTLIIKNNSFTLRDMITGKQEEVPKWRLNTLKERMKDEIKKNSPLR